MYICSICVPCVRTLFSKYFSLLKVGSRTLELEDAECSPCPALGNANSALNLTPCDWMSYIIWLHNKHLNYRATVTGLSSLMRGISFSVGARNISSAVLLKSHNDVIRTYKML